MTIIDDGLTIISLLIAPPLVEVCLVYDDEEVGRMVIYFVKMRHVTRLLKISRAKQSR